MKIAIDVGRQQIRIKARANELLEFIGEASLIEHFLEHVSIGGVESGGALVPPHPASRFRVQSSKAKAEGVVPDCTQTTNEPTAKPKAPTPLKKHAVGVKKSKSAPAKRS